MSIGLALNPARLSLLVMLTAPLALANCSSTTDNGGGAAGAATSAGGASTSGGAATSAGAPSAGAPVSSGGATSSAGAGGGLATSGAGGSSAAGAGGTSAGGSSSSGAGGAVGSAGATGAAGSGGATGAGGSTGGGFELSSPDQAEGAHFSSMFTCAAMNGTFGAGVNPELDWSGAPAGTQSFAITFIDTKIGADMAMGQHWAIWDIPATVMKFPRGTSTLTGDLAAAKQSNKYLAPCPSGNDTYEYTLYALSTATLNVTGADGTGTVNSAGVAKVLTALKAITPLGTATLHGTSMAMGK